MQPLSVVGPGAGAVVRSLAARLDGRVATVLPAERETTTGGDAGVADGGIATGAAESEPDVATTVELGEDGAWRVSGTDGTFTDLLETLAPTHDYVLAAGFTRLRVPTVRLTGGDERLDVDGSQAPAVDEIAGEVVETAATPEELDLDALAAEIDSFEPYVTLEELVREAKASPMAERSGAIATFTGRVRVKDAPDDDRTERLVFERYDGVAEERMNEIRARLESREEVFEVLMHHRSGVIEAGEDIVFVVVLAGHRKQAFRAVEDGIDLLKEEVPIFKKESTESEEFWLHERE
ncbi:molybdopterin synthase catalytic subunit [Halalkaliarchaeum desulfuricum]|uniref:Molybdopterin synthase catalytic subunit n=1 Tax=Halalkaliarchaeum desulfuricum TaxID=2055893 RepID=A0A343TNN3_9EURY|nr:molybdopterin synthase [Halalkaliarchaeum desulfuricum]AUX10705.1 molybdopterin synthase catalytic subunit [Halalkaliarchaeum desulfuricum]